MFYIIILTLLSIKLKIDILKDRLIFTSFLVVRWWLI